MGYKVLTACEYPRYVSRGMFYAPSMSGRNITIKNLAEVAAAKAARPAVFRPTKVNGKWRMAKWSALAIARARKKAILSGQSWPWDIPHKIVEKKVPFKGHKRYAQKLDRAEEVARCMARMPAMIDEYRKSRKKRSKGLGLIELISTPRKRTGSLSGSE